MGSLRLAAIVLLLGSPAFAQSPTYGVGRTPTAEEIRAADISIGPTGEELPPGRGTVKEGAQVYEQQGCIACHGAEGIRGPAPALKPASLRKREERASCFIVHSFAAHFTLLSHLESRR